MLVITDASSARSKGKRKVDGVDGCSETSLEAAGKQAVLLKTEVWGGEGEVDGWGNKCGGRGGGGMEDARGQSGGASMDSWDIELGGGIEEPALFVVMEGPAFAIPVKDDFFLLPLAR